MIQGAVTDASMVLLDGERETDVRLRIELLPTTPVESAALLDLRQDLDRDTALAPIQLIESTEYRYAIQPRGAGGYATDRPEIFLPDDRTGSSGRIRIGLATGLVPVTVSRDGRPVGQAKFEVRSKKFDYLRQYQWMMRDVATQMAEVVMERFAPAEHHFEIDEEADARTLYQRFCFLKSLLSDELFRAAVRIVLSHPYSYWEESEDRRNPAKGLKPTSKIVRKLAEAGWIMSEAGGRPASHGDARLSTRQILVTIAHDSLDNLPNRFVKFALESWRSEIARVESALQRLPASSPVRRGTAEVTASLVELDYVLTNDLFRGVGDLDQFPAASTILQQRAGYRDIYRAYLCSAFASKLSWPGGENVFGAGQRNVAALFEYWTFFQLANVLARLCGQSFDFGRLVQSDESGLSLGLVRGRQRVLSGAVRRLGRVIDVDLYFNRTFPRGRAPGTSWSMAMRPDCSVRLTPTGGVSVDVPDVWLHFDAKYRIESLLEILESDSAATDDPLDTAAQSAEAGPLREDLLKMHAYRDAIRRSAGAYVIYPGSDVRECREYHELLPGLGAFGLQPAEDGAAIGATAIETFLNDTITHVASQITQHERSRFWSERSFAATPVVSKVVEAAEFLHQPPADALVLLGYVKSQSHLDWIRKHALYNLRADSRNGAVGLNSQELSSEFLLLYGNSIRGAVLYPIIGGPRLVTDAELLALGYPAPGGKLYYCIELQQPMLPLGYPGLENFHLDDLTLPASHQVVLGAPLTITWQGLAQALA